MKVVWLIQNLVPYHHTRFEAFCSAFEGEAHVVQMTNKDTFGVLECRPEESPYQLHTVFEGATAASVTGPEAVQAVLQLLRRLQPDCVCVSGWGLLIGQAAILAALKARFPIVLCSDSNEFDASRIWYKEAIKRRIVKVCSAYFVAGSLARSYIRNLGGMDIVDGYDVVDNRHFSHEGDRPPELPVVLEDTNWLFSCARFGEKKNLLRLIEAYSGYHRDCVQNNEEPSRLVIAGDGELRADIEAKIHQNDMADQVILLGAVEYGSLPWLYQNAQAFVHASTTEQWGLVVNEAMAAGAPVLISQRCGCAPDLVFDGENGFQFDPYSEEDIAKALWKFHRLTDSDRRKFSKRSREIIQDWGPQRFAAALVDAVGCAVDKGAATRTLIAAGLLRLLLAKG